MLLVTIQLLLGVVCLPRTHAYTYGCHDNLFGPIHGYLCCTNNTCWCRDPCPDYQRCTGNGEELKQGSRCGDKATFDVGFFIGAIMIPVVLGTCTFYALCFCCLKRIRTARDRKIQRKLMEVVIAEHLVDIARAGIYNDTPYEPLENEPTVPEPHLMTPGEIIREEYYGNA